MEINVHASNDNSSIVFEPESGALSAPVDDAFKDKMAAIVERTFEKLHHKTYAKIKYEKISVKLSGGKVHVYLLTGSDQQVEVKFTTANDKKMIKALQGKDLRGEDITVTIEKGNSDIIERLFNEKAPVLLGKEESVNNAAGLGSKKVTQVKELPEPRGLRELKKQGSESVGIIRFIRRVFAYFLSVRPSVDSQIQNKLAGAEPSKVRSCFLQMMNDSISWIEGIKTTYPKLHEIYTDSELESIYEDRLLKLANHKLLQGGLSPIQHETEFVAFRAEKVVGRLANTNLPTQEIKEVLDTIPPEYMPVSKLAEIPNNSENKEMLEAVWKDLFGKFIEKGSLTDIEKLPSARRTEQARWAARLLHAKQVLGRDLPVGLPKLDIASLHHLVLAEDAFYDSPIILDDTECAKKQEIYVAVIKEPLNQLIFVHLENREAPGNSLDGQLIAGVLAGQVSSTRFGQTKGDRGLIESLLAEKPPGKGFNQEQIDAHLDMLPYDGAMFRGQVRQQQKEMGALFDDETLEKIYYLEVERAARDLYGFSDAQIENLRGIRGQKREDGWEARSFLSDRAINDVRTGNYSHPSGVANSTFADLMEVTRLVTIPADAELDESEQKKLLEKLQLLAEDKTLAKALSAFAVDNPTKTLADLLPSFLKRFTDIKATYRLPLGISERAVALVLGYQKLMTLHEKLAVPIAKAEALLGKSENPEDISNSEKLTYAEVGKLSKLSRFKKEIADMKEKAPLELLEDLGITEFTGDLARAKAQAEQAKSIIESLEQRLLAAFKETYKDGDILGYVASKKEQWTDRKLSGEEALTARIIDYGLTHGMKAYFDEQGVLCMSQLGSGNELNITDPLSMYEAFVSDGWRVTIAPLVHSSCKEALGERWEQRVQNEYMAIEKKIHQEINERFEKGIKNDQAMRVEAGLSDYPRLINFLGGVGGHAIQPHIVSEEQDFRQIHLDFIEGAGEEESVQICSEFVSKSTLAALMELNKNLSAEILKGQPNLKAQTVLGTLRDVELGDEVTAYLQLDHHKPVAERNTLKSLSDIASARKRLKAALVKNGWSADKAELMIRVNDNEVFDLPYDRRERMEAIHPGRMVTILEKAGCATRVEKPKIFEQMIKLK